MTFLTMLLIQTLLRVLFSTDCRS